MLNPSLVPFRAIKEYRPVKYLVEAHEHPYFHMIYVVSGKLLIICCDAKIYTAAGTVLLIPAHSVHMIYAVESTQSIELKFSCEGDLGSLSQKFETKTHWIWTPSPKSSAYFASIMEEAENKNAHYIEIISARIFDLLMQILRSQDSNSLPASDADSTEEVLSKLSLEPGLMSKAITYIDSHLQEKLSVSDIANQLGYSKSYFCTIFKKSVGITPQQFITYRKINAAKNLIRKGQLNMSAISDMLNFSSVSAFTNTFKRCCGISPGHYAQRIQECTYINLVKAPDLPLDDVRYIEPVFRENMLSLPQINQPS